MDVDFFWITWYGWHGMGHFEGRKVLDTLFAFWGIFRAFGFG